jgi:hypothetical protein
LTTSYFVWLPAIRNDLQLEVRETVLHMRRSASYWNIKLLAAVTLLSAALVFSRPAPAGALDLSICGSPIAASEAIGAAVAAAYVEDRIAAAAAGVVAEDSHVH